MIRSRAMTFNGQMMYNHQPDRPHIKKFMHDFNDRYREKFNEQWFIRNDDDIIEGMEQIILSCQRDQYFVLKVIDFEVIKDYGEIYQTLQNYYMSKSKNNKKIENEYDYISLRDSDIMLLKVRYYVKLNLPDRKIKVNSKTGEVDKTEGEIDTLIILPRYVNKYFFRILGKYYCPIFQIVDGSTYNNSTSNNTKVQSITLKTNMMPIKVYKESYSIIDLNDKSHRKVTLFTSRIFAKKTDTIKFLLGRYGLYGALELLGLEGIYVQSYEDPIKDPTMFYNFTDKSKKITINVIKRLFDKDNVTQSFVATVLKNTKKVTLLEDIFDPRFWVKALGVDFQSATVDKGISVLSSLESIYDVKTKQSINLPIEDKYDTYHILRWMMREFNFLKNKENIDISTKHPRLADEYLPGVYAKRISSNLYRITDKGLNIEFKDVVRAIDISPNYILNSINSIELSNLISFVDLVNDNDAELALSYTYKGISGLGENGSSAVPGIYRTVHPSQLGRVDLDSSPNSDPGLSGIICPMATLTNGSFSDYSEPNEWPQFYQSSIDELHDLYGVQQALNLRKKLGLEYDYVKENLVKETIESYQRLIPVLIDFSYKKDYTRGAPLEVLLVQSNNNDETGDLTYEEGDIE